MSESLTDTYAEAPVKGADNADALTVGVSPRAVTRWLLCIVLALTTVSVGVQLLKHPLDSPYAHGLVPLLDATGEGNVPTFYSSLTLLVCALLAGMIAISARRGQVSRAGHWTGLSLLLGLAALDEAAQVHELSLEPLRSGLDLGGYLSYSWIVPASILVVGVALVYARFMRELPDPVRRPASVGIVLLAVGAILLEAIEGKLWASAGQTLTFATDMVASVQELGEMLGVVLLLYALLTFMRLRGLALYARVRSDR